MNPHEFHRAIVSHVRGQADQQITKKQVVATFGTRYYCNADKHLGTVLATMVRRGLLQRIRPGLYGLGRNVSKKQPEGPHNQTKLFV